VDKEQMDRRAVEAYFGEPEEIITGPAESPRDGQLHVNMESLWKIPEGAIVKVSDYYGTNPRIFFVYWTNSRPNVFHGEQIEEVIVKWLMSASQEEIRLAIEKAEERGHADLVELLRLEPIEKVY
jgi:hypothetical protein